MFEERGRSIRSRERNRRMAVTRDYFTGTVIHVHLSLWLQKYLNKFHIFSSVNSAFIVCWCQRPYWLRVYSAKTVTFCFKLTCIIKTDIVFVEIQHIFQSHFSYDLIIDFHLLTSGGKKIFFFSLYYCDGRHKEVSKWQSVSTRIQT